MNILGNFEPLSTGIATNWSGDQADVQRRLNYRNEGVHVYGQCDQLNPCEQGHEHVISIVFKVLRKPGLTIVGQRGEHRTGIGRAENAVANRIHKLAK